MSTDAVLSSFAKKQGWNEEAQLALCIEYINNQDDQGTFSDFLQRHADEENEDAV